YHSLSYFHHFSSPVVTYLYSAIHHSDLPSTEPKERAGPNFFPACHPARLLPSCVGCEGSLSHRWRPDHPAALLLRPGRNYSVAARVRDRLPQMLMLILENQHQRVQLRHVSSEQFHRRPQVVVGKSRNRFLQIDVRSL